MDFSFNIEYNLYIAYATVTKIVLKVLANV